MRYHQLRMLTFMIGMLVHGSETASFLCNTETGPVNCNCQVGEADADTGYPDFRFSTTQGCTQDGQYCAQITAETDEVWEIVNTIISTRVRKAVIHTDVKGHYYSNACQHSPTSNFS
jgi:hypothetical protein